MKLDPQSQAVVSHYSKKQGGLSGFVSRNINSIGKITTLIEQAGILFPGISKVTSFLAKGIKVGAQAIADGKFSLSSIWETVSSFLPKLDDIGSFFGGLFGKS